MKEEKTIGEYMINLAMDIHFHNNKYHNENSPEISDDDYDTLVHTLKALEEKYPEEIKYNSPIKKVGAPVQKNFPTVKHEQRMFSLSNCFNEKDLISFDERVSKISGGAHTYIIQDKIDGVAISLIYKNGRLKKCVTRGDGIEGSDVTENVKTIESIPHRINKNSVPPNFEVRGEIYMKKSVFNRLNESLEKKMANPRNATAGALHLKDPEECRKRELSLIPYQVIADRKFLLKYTDVQLMNLLNDLGFDKMNNCLEKTNLDGIDSLIQSIYDKKSKLDYETDGIVFKVNQIKYRYDLGYTDKYPRWATAFKFPEEKAVATLDSVIFSIGRTGAVTPVANFSPVFLGGTRVMNASLYNFDEIKRLGLKIGDEISIIKSGEIIPKVLSVVNNCGHTHIETPTHCPECGGKLEKKDDSVTLYCTNTHNCPPQIKAKIEHFASAKALNIEGLGNKIISQLVDNSTVKNISDLYYLDKSDLSALERVGPRLAEKILASINKSKSSDFFRVLYGIGIPSIGIKMAKDLAHTFKNIQNLINASYYEISKINGLGEPTSKVIKEFLSDPININIINALIDSGVNFTAEESAPTSDKLNGLKFAISGKFHLNRNKVKEIIESNGGTISSSISKNTDYFLIGADCSESKVKKAEELEISIIYIEQLKNLI